MSQPHAPSVGIITTRSPSGEHGGAERLYDGLVSAFRSAGWHTEEVPIIFDESCFETILQGYETARRLDVLSYDLVVSTKAPTFAVRHPNHACWLVHTIRVFYDLFEQTFPDASASVMAQRNAIVARDTAALGRPGLRRFSIGRTVSQRLSQFNGLDSIHLHPPSPLSAFRNALPCGYFFTASRLHPWKRLDLLVKGALLSRTPVELRIAGQGPDEARLRQLAGGSPRIKFLGRISDTELLDQYARCIGVPFVPLQEDYGYITLEAFLSGKPVLTCHDSGEAAELVRASGAGAIVEPTPEAVSAALQNWSKRPDEAFRHGQRGLKWARAQTWKEIVVRLTDPAAARAR